MPQSSIHPVPPGGSPGAPGSSKSRTSCCRDHRDRGQCVRMSGRSGLDCIDVEFNHKLQLRLCNHAHNMSLSRQWNSDVSPSFLRLARTPVGRATIFRTSLVDSGETRVRRGRLVSYGSTDVMRLPLWPSARPRWAPPSAIEAMTRTVVAPPPDACGHPLRVSQFPRCRAHVISRTGAIPTLIRKLQRRRGAPIRRATS